MAYKSQFLELFQIIVCTPFYTLSRGEGAPKGRVWNAGEQGDDYLSVGICSIPSAWVPAGGGTFCHRIESTQRSDLGEALNISPPFAVPGMRLGISLRCLPTAAHAYAPLLLPLAARSNAALP